MPELTETELRSDPLAEELRTYFRATTATPRPLQTATPQPAPAPAPRHRWPLKAAFGTVLAVTVAAAIAVPVVLNRASSGPAGSSGALLVFMSEPAPSTNPTQIPFTQLPKYASTSCLFALETAPVSGGPLRSAGSVNLCNGNEQPVIVGDHLVGPATSAPDAPGAGLDLIDLGTGTERTIPLEGVAGSVFPSPGGIDLAVPIEAGANGLPALDVFDVTTGALLRQLQPEVDGSVISLGGASASAWLSDGIHTTVQACFGAAAASCDYLINPVTGAVHTLVESTTTSVEDYGSPSGTEEARLSQEITTTGPGGTATISAGPAGGTLSTVYTLPAAAMNGTLGIEVANDGTLMFQTSFTTDVVSQGRPYPVTPSSGWTLGVFAGGAGALPGGGFAIEATRQVKGATFQEEVLRISDNGSTTVIQGPLPAATNFPLLIGVAS